jgi:hypothetical protein
MAGAMSPVPSATGLRLLVFYDENSTYTGTVLEHLQSFRLSEHEVFFAPGVRGAPLPLDLAAFDVVIVHYSVRLSLPDFISPEVAAALPGFVGLKILYIQDEYDTTETARTWIERLGFDIVFTCVPESSVEKVYPAARFPKTDFITTLTGFVPASFERPLRAPAMNERKLYLAYRGRALPYWYGLLGREKLVIGQRMKQICAERGVPCDIEWEEEKRIYGKDWYVFLMSARATLATESGSNVFDDHGEIRRAIEAALAANPNATFEDLYPRIVAPHEGKVRMNQISPRVFEAISVGTGLVLFEGEYSGVLRAWDHYLPLKKDFSNVDEIFAKLADDAFMTAMIERAHRDVIASGRFGYREAIRKLDEILARRAVRSRKLELFMIVMGAAPAGERPTIARVTMDTAIRELATNEPLRLQEAERQLIEPLTPAHLVSRGVWRALPANVRTALRPVLPAVKPALQKIWRR